MAFSFSETRMGYLINDAGATEQPIMGVNKLSAITPEKIPES